jgi:hypothetical protein
MENKDNVDTFAEDVNQFINDCCGENNQDLIDDVASSEEIKHIMELIKNMNAIKKKRDSEPA